MMRSYFFPGKAVHAVAMIAITLVAATPAVTSAAATPQGERFTVDARRSVGGSVGRAADGSFIVVYEVAELNAPSDHLLMQRYDAAGAAVGGPVDVVEPTADRQSPGGIKIAMASDGRYAITWQDFQRYGLFVRSFAADGSPRGPSIQVDNGIVDQRSFSQADLIVDADGIARLVWNRTIVQIDREIDFLRQSINIYRATTRIVTRRFDATAATSAESVIASAVTVRSNLISNERPFTDPVIATPGNGNFAVSWTARQMQQIGLSLHYTSQLLLRRYDASGAAAGPATTITATTAPQGQPYNFDPPSRPALAATSNGYVLAWTQTRNLMLQRLDVLGQPLAAVATVPAGPCEQPPYDTNIAASANYGLVITFACTYSGSRPGLRGYRYAADSTPIGGYDISIAPGTFNQGYSSSDPQTSFDASGNFVTVWSDALPFPDSDTFSDFRVRGQRYTSGN